MKLVFQVEKRNGQGCARKVAAAVETVAPGAEVQVDLTRKTVEVHSQTAEAAIAAAIRDAGFPATALA